MKNYTDQELIGNIHRAGTGGCDIGSDSVWSVAIVSCTTPATVFVHAPNVTTAKRIGKQYAQRIMRIADATAQFAELLA